MISRFSPEFPVLLVLFVLSVIALGLIMLSLARDFFRRFSLASILKGLRSALELFSSRVPRGSAIANFLCRIGVHELYIDSNDGASGHSMAEAIAFLHGDIARCARCPHTHWIARRESLKLPHSLGGPPVPFHPASLVLRTHNKH